jgi:peptide deformylase
LSTTAFSAESLPVIRPIVLFPDPVLQRSAEAIAVFDESVLSLATDLFDSMYRANGIGLAAPQIGVSKRVMVIDVSNGGHAKDKLAFINPEIVSVDGREIDEEGCLSLPDIREKVARAAKVRVRAQNVSGQCFEMEAEGLLSRALQHEIDHLDGILFFSRLSSLKRNLILRRIRKLKKAGQWHDDVVTT